MFVKDALNASFDEFKQYIYVFREKEQKVGFTEKTKQKTNDFDIFAGQLPFLANQNTGCTKDCLSGCGKHTKLGFHTALISVCEIFYLLLAVCFQLKQLLLPSRGGRGVKLFSFCIFSMGFTVHNSAMMNKNIKTSEANLQQQINDFIKKNKFPLIVFFLAFVVRFAYLIDFSGSPFFQVHIADALFHGNWAMNILNGDFFSLHIDGVFYKAPFYPYFIALVYFIAGYNDFVLMTVQVLMDSFSCVLIFLVAREYFGAIAAFVGATIYALYFPAIFYSTEMEIPALAIFLTLLSFYLIIINNKWPCLVVSSLVFGFSMLALPTNLLLAPLYIYILFKKQGVKIAAVFTVLTFLTLLPCTLRNSIVGKHFTLISANGGINFYIGNNADYDNLVGLQPGYEFEEFYDEPRRTEGKVSFAERDSYWYKKAFGFIFNYPVKEMKLIFKKFVLCFSDYEIMRNIDMYYAKDNSIFRNIPFFPASFIFATGFAGLFFAFYRKKGLMLFYLCFLLALPCILFFVTARYRLPSVCIWAVFSGFGITSIFNLLKSRAWLASTIAIGAVAGMVVLSGLNIFVVKNPVYRPHFNLGFVYEEQGKYPQALEEYSMSLDFLKATRPEDYMTESEVYARIGNLYMKMDNFGNAEENFYKAIEINPNSYPAYSYLGSLYGKQKKNDMAIEMYNKAIGIYPWDAVSIYNFGNFYLDNNLIDEAFDKFEETIEISPEHAGAYSNLAYIYGLRGNFGLMEKYAKIALRYNPDETPARFNLARLYQNTDRVGEAIAEFEKIAQKSPEYAVNAYNQLGVIYAQKNNINQAIHYWEKALEIDPANQNAKANLQRANQMLGR